MKPHRPVFLAHVTRETHGREMADCESGKLLQEEVSVMDASLHRPPAVGRDPKENPEQLRLWIKRPSKIVVGEDNKLKNVDRKQLVIITDQEGKNTLAAYTEASGDIKNMVGKKLVRHATPAGEAIALSIRPERRRP